jgi:hypothetical protein
MLTLSIPPERLGDVTLEPTLLSRLFERCPTCSGYGEGLSIFHAPLHVAHVVPSELLSHLSV